MKWVREGGGGREEWVEEGALPNSLLESAMQDGHLIGGDARETPFV